MTRPQVFFFIALGLVLLLFAGSVIYGQGQSNPNCSGNQEACADERKQVIQRLRGLFSAAGPGAELPQPRYTIEPDTERKVSVEAASESVRTLKLQLESGQGVKLTYENELKDPDVDKEGVQDKTLPRTAKTKEDARQMSFAVTRKGGTVTMKCLGKLRCVVISGE